MHKDQAKVIMKAAGVPVPKGVTVADRRSGAPSATSLPPPYVVKPVNEGSSVGVIIVTRGAHPPAPGTAARGLAVTATKSLSRSTFPAAS